MSSDTVTIETPVAAHYYDAALEDAEKACFKKVCEILGLRSGVNAFIALLPVKADCIVFDIGGLWTGDTVTFPASAHHFRGRLDLYSRSRPTLQRWLSRLLAALPNAPTHGRADDLVRKTNVTVFRIAPLAGAYGQITTTTIKADEQDKGFVSFTCAVGVDVVFTTAPRAQ